MKKIVQYAAMITLAVLFAVYPFQTASAQVGLYLGGWGGYTIHPDATEDDWDDYYDDVDLDFDETSAWGAKIGYTNPFFKYLALEAEYLYLNPEVEDDYVLDGDVKMSNLMFNIIGKYPLGIIQPYFGLGLGFSYADTSWDGIRGIDDGDYTSYAWQIMTGLEIFLTSEIAVDVGYRYFATEMEFDHEDSDDVTFSTGMVTLGLKVFF
ncbi:MAG TPA: outer membrane beta-barrel protein [Smithella sp.]|nr:outer membrane beta-barrel protein [Smithella sp.]